MKKEHAVFGIIAGILLLLDQLLKSGAEFFLAEKSVSLNSFITLEYTKNTGIAFGIPITGMPLLIANSVIMIFFVVMLVRFADFSHRMTATSMALIFAGALGNLIDRIGFGFVRDFISIGPWPTFNLADTAITIGAMLVLIFHKHCGAKRSASSLLATASDRGSHSEETLTK